MQASQVINNLLNNSPLEELSYEFVTQALVIYQDELSDSDQKMNAIKLIVATLSHFNKNHLSAENYDTLTTNANQYC